MPRTLSARPQNQIQIQIYGKPSANGSILFFSHSYNHFGETVREVLDHQEADLRKIPQTLRNSARSEPLGNSPRKNPEPIGPQTKTGVSDAH